MSNKPDSSCVLSVIIGAKLCTILSLLIECLRLTLSFSFISSMRIQTVEYKLITMVLSTICAVVIVLDLTLMFSVYSNHFNITKKLILVDLWIQLILFIPVLIGVIVFTAATKEDHFTASWMEDFNVIKSLSSKSIYVQYNVTDLAYYNIDDVVYLDDFDSATTMTPPPAVHLAAVNVEDSILRQLLQRKNHVDQVQMKLKCCGLNGPSDWLKKFSGPINPETQATTQYLWWSYESALVDVPPSCCHKVFSSICGLRGGNSTITVKRSTIGCWPVATTFVRQFTLIVASVVLILIVLTIPRNIWMYRLTEVRRRKQRALDCHKFTLKCRHDYDHVRYLEVITKRQTKIERSIESTQTKSKTLTELRTQTESSKTQTQSINSI